MNRRREIIERISSIRDLPSLPQIVAKVQAEIGSPNATANTMSQIISEDPAISIRVLKVANSPVYSLGKEISDTKEAVVILGFQEIYNIVLSMSTLNLFGKAHHIDYKRFWQHSLSVAFATKAIVDFAGGDYPRDKKRLADLFIAGLLHDIGVLVLDQFLPDKYESVLKEASATEDLPLYGIEFEHLGITHAEVGSYLLRQWHIPEKIVSAVAFHHLPGEAGDSMEISQIVHIANFICNNQGIDNGVGIPPESFSDCAWMNLNMSVDDIANIITEVRSAAEKSPILMALV
ncbi:MAG: HDOD domain-containing protein [Deltaproteobacteria bacterium]|nr:HDOD domain-containing protein [Deltaproteobacteria bacterium]